VNWKSESLALIFGMLVIFMIFGDAAQVNWVGNLDYAFGHIFWPATDVIYPLASVVVFLLYGRSKGILRLHRSSILLFIAFLISILIIQLDDLFVVLNHPIELSAIYWTAARWFYPIAAITTFFAFGHSCKNKGTANSQ
jgi:hypothetical protein